LQTVTHCLQRGGYLAEGEHVRLLLDCADVCRVTADFVARGSEFHEAACDLCAGICLRCAELCELIADAAKLHECADVCRSCADACMALISRAEEAVQGGYGTRLGPA
jgi:hypothetical protein